MSRAKQYQSNAARQKAYRQRHQIDDLERLNRWKQAHPNHQHNYTPNNKRKRVRRKEDRMHRPFIGFDGEGIDTNNIKTYLKGKSELNGLPIYEQHYTILTASTGDYIEDWENGLSTEECLEFLLKFTGDNYLVGFYFGYDVVKILRDLSPGQLAQLWKKGNVRYNNYYISYIPNKIFRVSDIYETGSERHVTIFDVSGFFQKSFIRALEDWQIDCPDIIKEGKKRRKSFRIEERQEIRQYNLLECLLLVELMTKMRAAMHTVGIVPSFWYGVGAMAQLVLREQGVKAHVETPHQMIPEFLKAYYGGRNQVMKLGEFDKVYLHDINSAYPHAMIDLPSSIGQWIEQKPGIFYDHPYALYEIEWDLPPDTIITPFPVRCDGNIYFPLKGSGTYWEPEVRQGILHYQNYITIKKVWTFFPENENVRPFAFYRDYYAQRQRFIKEGNDAQLVLKLALNAGYGKVAQSVGKFDKMPEFQNFFWAGMITSQTRAKVFELAMKSPKDIIAFATDGVMSRKKLTDHSPVKELGAWEVKEVADYFIIQTGIYTYKDGDVEKFKSRGFGYKSVDYDAVRAEWRRNGVMGSYHYTELRFIGIGVGLQRRDPNLIGCWVELPRRIAFYPQTMTFKPHKKIPRHLDLRPVISVGKSDSYQMKTNWLAAQDDQNKQDDLDQYR